MRRYHVNIVVVLLGICASSTRVSADKISEYKALMQVPANVILDESQTIQIVAGVTTPEGMLYESQVDGEVSIWADYGQFVMPNGVSSFSPVALSVTGGQLRAVLSLAGRTDVPYPLNIRITRGTGADREELGHMVIDIRYAASVELSDHPVTSVQADGNAHPVIVATWKDQYGQPIPNLKVRAHCVGPKGDETRFEATADANGQTSVQLPASTKAGTGIGQLEAGCVATPTIELQYSNAPPVMVSLREAAKRIGAALSWDCQTNTATATRANLVLAVHPGDLLVRVNGEIVYMNAPAELKGGRVLVPSMLVQQISGISGLVVGRYSGQ